MPIPVDTERVETTLAELVRIPSVNPFDADDAGEGAIAQFVASRLSELGAEVEVSWVAPGRPNVIGTFTGSAGPSIMLAGHLDTVGVTGMQDPFEPRVESGRMYGRGAADMKGGLAALLEVASLISGDRDPLPGNVTIAALCDEEYGMIGSQAIGTTGPVCDFGVVAEPTDLRICPAHRGQIGLLIRTLGKAAHSSKPELGVNAISQMAKVVAALADYGGELESRPPHPLCGHGTMSPGVIAGGTSASIVPESCDLEIDRRTLPGEDYRSVHDELQALLGDIARHDPGFRYELIGPTWDIQPLDLPADAPVVRALVESHTAVVGVAPEIAAFPAATDAPNLGFPAVVYGPGSLDQAHAAVEYVEIGQVALAAEVLYRLVGPG